MIRQGAYSQQIHEITRPSSICKINRERNEYVSNSIKVFKYGREKPSEAGNVFNDSPVLKFDVEIQEVSH